MIRKGILTWGVPAAIKSDNGSDFVSYRFQQALLSLGIEHRVCTPFTPEAKPHVERVIGTMQRDLMPMLPGFVGHSVADRKKIEARKTFAARLGEDRKKLFNVTLIRLKCSNILVFHI